MGRLSRYLGRLGWAGVGGVLVSVAYNAITQVYPLTGYTFISAEVARVLFWISVGIGGLGVVSIVIALVKSTGHEQIPETEVKPDIVSTSEQLGDTLTKMHRRLVEIQKEKASHTKVSVKQLEKVLPTLADRMGTVKLEDWPKFEKKVRQRVQQAMPRRFSWRPLKFMEYSKLQEEAQFAALSVARQIKDELFQSKEWTFEDGLKASKWLDGYNWGVKEVRDNDPQWKALWESISSHLQDAVLRKLIEKHIDLSYIYNNLSLIIYYSEQYPKNVFSTMLHETLVGSPISPSEAEIALSEILSDIEMTYQKQPIKLDLVKLLLDGKEILVDLERMDARLDSVGVVSAELKFEMWYKDVSKALRKTKFDQLWFKDKEGLDYRKANKSDYIETCKNGLDRLESIKQLILDKEGYQS